MAEAKEKAVSKKQKVDSKQAAAQKDVANEVSEPKVATVKTKPRVSAQNDQQTDDPKLAKAGKRSAKAVAEAEEKLAKEERKTKTADEKALAKPKASIKPVRSRLERRSKGYRKSAEQIDKSTVYTLAEAVELAKKTSNVKFDASVELHVNLNVDPKQADQNIRGTVVLPAGTGKTINVAVADDDLLAKLDKGQIDFDVLVATPDFMPKLGKYAKLLGPRGLMPNPKSGTVATDVKKAVEEAKAGRVEYRLDSTGIVHTAFGKVSFSTDDLQKNASSILDAIRAAKPASIKGIYLKSAFVTTTMGPSIRLKVE